MILSNQSLAGRTKLTAVTLTFHGKKYTDFFNLIHNEKGEAILPMTILNKMCDRAKIQRGDTYSIA